MMEWNANPPLQWDWENLIMFNAMAAENPRKMEQAGWEMDGDGGIDSASFFSSGVGDGSGGSSSDLGLTSLSKSSKSASNNSSSVGEMKTSKFNLEAFDDSPEGFDNNKEFSRTEPISGSPTVEVSVGSGEPLLGLKLGKRMYFEDFSAGSNAKNSSLPAIPASSVTPAKRSRSKPQTTLAARCQVESCNLDLSSAKDYHQKHRVCENHSKCPKVIVGGLERRFCQQCSRFHGLSEFDEKKRSCRRRLSDHNARRRKPRAEAVRLNDGKQQMSIFWNGVPFVHTNPNENFSWEGACGSKSNQTIGYGLKSAKSGGTDGLLHFCCNLPNSVPAHHHDSNGFLLSKAKGTVAEGLDQGPEESMISFNLGMAQDCHHALSLLSTTSWGLCEPKLVSREHPMITRHTNISQTMMPAVAQGSQFASSEYRPTEKQSTECQVHPLSLHHDEGNYIQEIQLFRGPYGSNFYSNVD